MSKIGSTLDDYCNTHTGVWGVYDTDGSHPQTSISTFFGELETDEERHRHGCVLPLSVEGGNPIRSECDTVVVDDDAKLIYNELINNGKVEQMLTVFTSNSRTIPIPAPAPETLTYDDAYLSQPLVFSNTKKFLFATRWFTDNTNIQQRQYVVRDLESDDWTWEILETRQENFTENNKLQIGAISTDGKVRVISTRHDGANNPSYVSVDGYDKNKFFMIDDYGVSKNLVNDVIGVATYVDGPTTHITFALNVTSASSPIARYTVFSDFIVTKDKGINWNKTYSITPSNGLPELIPDGMNCIQPGAPGTNRLFALVIGYGTVNGTMQVSISEFDPTTEVIEGLRILMSHSYVVTSPIRRFEHFNVTYVPGAQAYTHVFMNSSTHLWHESRVDGDPSIASTVLPPGIVIGTGTFQPDFVTSSDGEYSLFMSAGTSSTHIRIFILSTTTMSDMTNQPPSNDKFTNIAMSSDGARIVLTGSKLNPTTGTGVGTTPQNGDISTATWHTETVHGDTFEDSDSNQLTVDLGIPPNWTDATRTIDISKLTDGKPIQSKHNKIVYTVTPPDTTHVLSPGGTASAIDVAGIILHNKNTTVLTNSGLMYVVATEDLWTPDIVPIWHNNLDDQVSATEHGQHPSHKSFANNEHIEYLVSENGRYMTIKTSANIRTVINTYNDPLFGTWTGKVPVRKSSALSSMVSFCHDTRSDIADPLAFSDPHCFCLPDVEIIDSSFNVDSLTTLDIASLVTHVPCITTMCSQTLGLNPTGDTVPSRAFTETCDGSTDEQITVCDTIVTTSGDTTIDSAVIETCGSGEKECDKSSDCAVGSTCNDDLKLCKMSCQTSSDCNRGEICQNLQCLKSGEPSSTDDGLSTGAIVGIIVGVLVVAGIAVGTYYAVKKKKKKST
jgi:hypothetical protein